MRYCKLCFLEQDSEYLNTPCRRNGELQADCTSFGYDIATTPEELRYVEERRAEYQLLLDMGAIQ